MYLSYQNDKIVGYTEEPQDLVLYNLDKVEETTDEYILDGDEYVKVDEEYEQKKVDERKESFYKEFISTSLGNYRLVPKGYANAQQSIDLIDRFVSKMGSLNEQLVTMMIFYKTPDFTKPEQCTEKWLVNNQYNPETMTQEEWDKFYFEFSQLYAKNQYKS